MFSPQDTATLEPALRPGIQREPPRPSFQGLCSTCEGAAQCTYPRDPARPVMQCEEFEDGVGRRLATLRAPGAAAAIMLPEAPVETLLLWGLCRTCESRGACSFSRPDGGAWHCEEYR